MNREDREMTKIMEMLRDQGIDEGLIADVEAFRSSFEVEESERRRVTEPMISLAALPVSEMTM